ncbi:alkylation response protein AidB-like acyl-CoA dehydrogenase [Streptomyces luteogriseus]|uniref:hypothetical protein n=1 Tax=Streptomyces luteogriseus TaxID=68233 RepID=UPI002789EE1F|nr:hypothetical protein [Streptomyces luteogriseus]MDQ0710609.1 alkylation response protein AidB-like acyl-CoA dehydrogenase [Streptomyces luteogriseus]
MPREHTFTFDSPQRTIPLYRCPVMYRCNTPGVALGCARGALSEFTALFTSEATPVSAGPRRESPLMQDVLARAHAQIASARAYAYTTVSDLWTVSAAATTRAGRRRGRGQGGHGVQACGVAPPAGGVAGDVGADFHSRDVRRFRAAPPVAE